MVKLSSWTFGYVVTNQIALIVIKNLAEPGSGNQDAYSKAFTFFMLPHGLLAISIATTFVPELVRRVRAGDKDGFGSWLTAGVRWISILTIPASVAIVILAHPIISAILEHGHFDSLASHNTSRALAGFSIGLAGFSIYIFCLRGFYAHEDTRTPFFINVFENALNIALALVLVNRHGVLGLGMSFGIAYMVSSVLVVGAEAPAFAVVLSTPGAVIAIATVFEPCEPSCKSPPPTASVAVFGREITVSVATATPLTAATTYSCLSVVT
jgi:putative peptidoglycan lipid II flippase